MKKIILASQSPRRSEILRKANYDFVSIPTHVSEIPDINLNTDQQIIDIARRKALACLAILQDYGPVGKHINMKTDLILAADTMVCLPDQIIGKPDTKEMAFYFLRQLSGKTHQVKTGVFIIDLASKDQTSILETTEVTFHNLQDEEILDYIATSEPMDKAGAYAIQGLGRKFISNINGDFDNVVGLPLHAIEKLFKIKSWICSRRLPDQSS